MFVAALGLRIGYMLLAIQNLGLDSFWQWAPDARTYWQVSEELTRGIEFGDYWLLRVGPGYGLVLAGLRWVFGDTHLPPILLNILLGACAPVVIYLLAWRLFSVKAIALAAGIITAVSTTSIALSCHALTDQPSFTFHAAALLTFVMGMQSGRVKWFVLSGLAAAVATYIRPSGQFWPLIFLVIPLLIPTNPAFGSRWKQFGVASITGCILLVSILGWSARNWVKYDLFTFGTNGVHTVEWCLIARAVAANTPGESIGSVRDRWHEEEEALLEHAENWFPLYTFASEKVKTVVTQHPDWVIKSYLRSLDENLQARNYYTERQILQFKPFFAFLNDVTDAWFGYFLFVVTLVGFVWMIIRKEYLAWLLLGATYAYNTAMLGLSFWQGSRLHYQAEMAWAIVAAYVGYRVYLAVVHRMGRTKVPSSGLS
jgi:4-amino-4-deoxy-L-arabinose transferase-like glycosyltransferase